MIFCSLLEKSKICLNRVKWAFKSVKRLKITAISKETIWKRLSAILYTHGWVVYSQMVVLHVVTSSFSDSIVFAVHTRKTTFSNSTVFKSFHSGERFRNDPFSDRCSVDGSRIRNKTVSFLFENGVVWTGSKPYALFWNSQAREKVQMFDWSYCTQQNLGIVRQKLHEILCYLVFIIPTVFHHPNPSGRIVRLVFLAT